MPNQKINNNNHSGGGIETSSEQQHRDRLALENELENLNKQISCNSTVSLAPTSIAKKSNLTKIENELQLLEKRMIIFLKLKNWNELIEEGYRILGKKGPSVIVYKCVLVGLCRIGRYNEDVIELLNQWKKIAPKDMEMLETTQKMSGYLNAIRSGVHPNDLFLNLEEALGLNAEWLTNNNMIASQFNWKYRPPPKNQTTFYLCPRAASIGAGSNSCMYGDKCISAHCKAELAEWKVRQDLKGNNSSKSSEMLIKAKDQFQQSQPQPQLPLPMTKLIPVISLNYLREITKRINETKDLRSLLADQLADVKFICSTPLKLTKTLTLGGGENLYHLLLTKWTFLIGSRQPVRTVCLLHDLNRDYFSMTSALFVNSAGKNLNLIDLHEMNKAQMPRLQVLNTFVPQQMFNLLGGWPEWFYYKIELTFAQPVNMTQIYGSFRQTLMFDFKTDPKLVKHLAVEVVPVQSPTEFSISSNIDVRKLSVRVEEAVHVGQTFNSVVHKESSPPLEITKKNSSEGSGTLRLGNSDVFDLVDSEAGLLVSQPQQYEVFNFGDSESENSSDWGNNEDEFILSKENYVQTMTRLLSGEVKARIDELSKFNLTTTLGLTSNYTIEKNFESFLKCSYSGQLYGKLELDSDITEDTTLGRLILRNCNSVYLAPLDKLFRAVGAANTNQKPRVYICKIADKLKSSIIISIGPRAVSELSLTSGKKMKFHIQFQLDLTYFREMKRVLDEVGDIQLNLLFPYFGNPKDWVSFPKEPIGLFYEGDLSLNLKQMEAYNAITFTNNLDNFEGGSINFPIPPILINGPFGTGKTHTLAQSLKKLLLSPVLRERPNRVLICTRSNSAADLYITNFIHPWLINDEMRESPTKPLRIYLADRMVHSVPRVVKQYCLFTNDGFNFRYPTKEEVLKHRIIIVTLSTSLELIKLGLHTDTFSHILLDEAAQSLETETIQPLILAGRDTRVVLAGDHKQLSPELFSSKDITVFRPVSLLERLSLLYPDNHPCRISLMENYRSHKAILKCASDRFYNSELRCASIQPVHSLFYPLTFFSVTSGEEVQPENSSSYFNMAEVHEVVDRVASLVHTWPPQWEPLNDNSNSIVVLSQYSEQVVQLRAQLSLKGLGFVNVERVLSVQGKQFRVVFISTVRTFKKSGQWITIGPEDKDLGFFTNAKILNTALTRAQSLIAVVGNPVSLCTIGNCSTLWQEFIQTAYNNKSLFGITADEIMRDLKSAVQDNAINITNKSVIRPPSATLPKKPSATNISGLNIQEQTPFLSETRTISAAISRPQFNLHQPNALPLAFQSSSVFPDSLPRKSIVSSSDEDFLDKILNTNCSSTATLTVKSQSNIAALWDDTNNISNNKSPLQTQTPPPPGFPTSSIWNSNSPTVTTSSMPFSSFTEPSISSSIWSTSSTLPQSNSNSFSSNNNNAFNLGLSKSNYNYEQQYKSAYDLTSVESKNISQSSYYENLMLDQEQRTQMAAQDIANKLYAQQQSSRPSDSTGRSTSGISAGVIGEGYQQKPVVSSDLHDQYKLLPANFGNLFKSSTSVNPRSYESRMSGNSLYQSLSNISAEDPTAATPINNIMDYQKSNFSPSLASGSTSSAFNFYGSTGNLPLFNSSGACRKSTYEPPPRMMKKPSALAPGGDLYTRNTPQKLQVINKQLNFTNAINSNDNMDSLFQQHLTLYGANEAASTKQHHHLMNIPTVGLKSATVQQLDNFSSASSTDESFTADFKTSLDNSDFPSLLSSVQKTSSEWVEVKKTKKASKTQQVDTPDGQLTTEKKIEALQQMGFDKRKAIRALQNCDKDLERAVEWLLAGGGKGRQSKS